MASESTLEGLEGVEEELEGVEELEMLDQAPQPTPFRRDGRREKQCLKHHMGARGGGKRLILLTAQRFCLFFSRLYSDNLGQNCGA